MSEDICTCDESSEDLHPCPYAQEINDDYDTLCSCCPECEYQCAQDI